MKKETAVLELKDFESLEFDQVLDKVEKSYNFKFVNTTPILTFGELCDFVAAQIKLESIEDCTSQQAFYKLREVISFILNIDNKTISIDSLLSDILPRKNRRSSIKKLEKHLGFNLSILRPPIFVTSILTFGLVLSFVGLFFNWQIGLSGLVFSYFGLSIANKIGNELSLQTVGQVAEKMTKENYLKSRRNPNTFNKNEIEKVLTNLFIDELNLDKNKLTRDSKFA